MAETKYSDMFSADQLRAELERVNGRKLFGRKKKNKRPKLRELPGQDELPKITVENGRIAFAEEPSEKEKAEKAEKADTKTNTSESSFEAAYKAFEGKNDQVFKRPADDAHGIGRGVFVNADDLFRSSAAETNANTDAFNTDAFKRPERTRKEKPVKPKIDKKAEKKSVKQRKNEPSLRFEEEITDDLNDMESDGFAGQLEAELSRVKHKREYGRMFRETIVILLGVAAAAVLISMLFLPVLRVTGSSMEPTLSSDDIVLCSRYSKLRKGDIAAFYFNNKVLLKRVIGVAGDVINISDNGYVTVNGKEVDEPYIKEMSLGECDLEFPFQVPENRIFVLGDNRSTSIDSRSSAVGCIADEYIIGKVFLRAFPFSKINTL